MLKIVVDSSANMKALQGANFANVPLKIITDEKQFYDDEAFSCEKMTSYLKGYKGRSGSACPSREDFIDAFGDADEVICITITSKLSGSFNAARLAKEEYESENEGKRVYVLDSYSCGGELQLLAERAVALYADGVSFDDICESLGEYAKKCQLLFCLKSLTNLVNNGRVSGAVAKISSLLNLRLVGIAADGEIKMVDKSRGEKHAITAILKNMKETGYKGGKVIISHCLCLESAKAIEAKIKAEYPDAVVEINETGALCSFYAEEGGTLIAYEGE